jgi:hypothetical protein
LHFFGAKDQTTSPEILKIPDKQTLQGSHPAGELNAN